MIKRIFIWILGVPAVLLVLWLTVGNLYASHRLKQARREWEANFGSYEALQQRYPESPANETALKLEVLAARLGIGLPPERFKQRVRPDAGAKAEWDRISEDDRGAHWKILARPDDGVEALPPPVAAFLEKHAQDLEDVESLLLQGPEPRWEMDPAAHGDGSLLGSARDALLQPPHPDMIGLVFLHRLLIQRGMMALQRGDIPDAAASLRASLSLGSAIVDRPELLAQMISLHAGRMWLALARKLPPSIPLPGDFMERDWRGAFREGFAAEQGFMRWRLEPALRSGGLSGFFGRPWSVFMTADLVRVWTHRILLFDRGDVCTFDRERLRDDPEARPAFYDFIGRIAMPNLDSLYARCFRILLEQELTRLVRAAKDGPGARPAERKTVPCAACASSRWVLAPQTGGGVVIALEPAPRWLDPEDRGYIPLRYTVPPPAPR
jgi:hypothetical protein